MKPPHDYFNFCVNCIEYARLNFGLALTWRGNVAKASTHASDWLSPSLPILFSLDYRGRRGAGDDYWCFHRAARDLRADDQCIWFAARDL